MDTAHQWPQGIVVKPIEEILTNNSCPKPLATTTATANNNLERKANRPQKEQALNCPRCNSTNTKFCYYNNYSLTQPRYFCKTCRRYWTEGGSLRNIPVGGGSRKNKRLSSTQSNSSTTSTPTTPNNNNISKRQQQQQQQLPDLIHGQDLNLSSTTYPNHSDLRNVISDNHPYVQNPNKSSPSSTTTTTTTSHLSALELLTGLTSRGFNSFMPIPIPDPTTTTNNSNSTVYPHPSGNLILPMHDFKPTLNFSLDGLGNGYGPLQGVQESNGRLLFPFEDLKQVGGNGGGLSMDQTNKDHGDSTGYWTGMLGGGSW